jgi:hypothetical protein
MTKLIKAKKQKSCVICGKVINVTIYSDKTYRGGHYFGKVPLHTHKALHQALKAGHRESKMGNISFQVLNQDPVAYKHIEYWECTRCYRNG